MDDAIKTLRERDSSCHLDMSLGALVTGYFIRCNAHAVMAFRNERDCNLFMLGLEAGEKPDAKRLAPPGTKNPAGWLNSMAVCVSKAVDDLAVANGRVQTSAEYCQCISAAWGGNLSGDEDISKLEGQFKSSMVRCARDHLGAAVTDEMADALWAVVVAATKAKGAKATGTTPEVKTAGEDGPAPAPASPPPDPAARQPSAP